MLAGCMTTGRGWDIDGCAVFSVRMRRGVNEREIEQRVRGESDDAEFGERMFI